MNSNMLVSLTEIKAYLRIDYDDDDELINSLVIASSEYITNATGISFDMNNSLASMCAKLLVAN